MVALQGYYDGNSVQMLEQIQAKKNQKLIITVLDDFIEDPPKISDSKTVRGALSQYANPELQKEEKS